MDEKESGWKWSPAFARAGSAGPDGTMLVRWSWVNDVVNKVDQHSGE